MPGHLYERATLKIDRWGEAYGTVLFFEDQEAIKSLQKQKSL